MSNASINFQRGNEYAAQGAAHKAIAEYLKVVKSEPGHSHAHINLARTFLNVGEYDKAESHAAFALTKAPILADAHNIRGLAQLHQGKLEAAEASFRQALATNQNSSDALCNLGITLVQRGIYGEAAPCLQRALELKPDSIEALYTYGMLNAFAGAYDVAESFMQRTLEINPNHPGALIAIGDFLSAKGNFKEAEAFLLRALAVNPQSANAWSRLPGLRKMTTEDSSWLANAEAIVRNQLHPNEEIPLRFAMGKYLDDVGNYEQAFTHFRLANELTKAYVKHRYDPNERSLFIDDLIRIYDRKRINQIHEGASASTRPVFVVGMPRSGTTLVEQIIAAHPEAIGAGELHFWGNAFKKHETAIRFGQACNGAIKDLAQEYLHHLACFSPGASRIVDKMPVNFTYLGLIHSVLPNAKIIHIQRDPIDTCLSIYFQKFSPTHSYATDLSDLAHYYREYRRLMAHWRSVLPAESLLEITYGSLIANQEEWSRRILDFIGLPWDEHCLEFEKVDRRVATASKWQVRQKLYRSSVGRWRHYENHIAPLMELWEAPP